MSDTTADTQSLPPQPQEGSLLSADPNAPFHMLRQDPANEAAWDEADEQAREADSPEEVHALYSEILSRPELPAETLELVGRRAVEFLDEWYEDPSGAVTILKQLITRDYGNSWALEKLSLLLTLSERWDDLLGIYDQALGQLEDEATRRHLLEEAARIAKDFAGQAQRASDYLKQLFLLDPKDEKLAALLERRLEQQERHIDLIEVWRARLGAVSAAEGLPLRVMIAERYLDHVQDAARALDTAHQILESGSGVEAACKLLERIAAHDGSSSSTKRAALKTLMDVYAEAERLPDVIRVLEAALDVERSSPDVVSKDAVAVQVNLFSQLVEWLILADEPVRAQHRAAEWLLLVATDSEALKQLRELARQTRDYAHFANALVSASDVLGDPELRVRLLLEAAQAQQEHAADPQAATDLYVRVLLDSESGDDAKLFAARRLTELLTNPAQSGQRLDVLEKLSVLEPDLVAQRQVLGEAAALAEKLHDDDRALRLWDECLDKDNSDVLALDAKVLILARTERWSGLLATLRARVLHAASEKARRADLVWIAKIYDENVNDLDQAIATFREIEESFERNHETVDALTELCLRAERFRDVVELLQEVEQQEDDAGRRTQQLTTLGEIHRKHLHSPDRAVQEYKKALELDSHHVQARDGLVALLELPECRHAAAEILADAYRQADEWENWLGLVELRFAVEPEADKKQSVLLQAAELVEKRAQDQAGALGFVRRAFSILPEADVEHEMLRLARATGGWSEAVEGYQRALSHCENAERTSELLFEQGHLLETELSDYSGALSSYRSILDLDAYHVAGASALVRCAGKVDDFTAASWGVLRSARAHGTMVAEVAESFTEAVREADAWDRALLSLTAQVAAQSDLPAKTSHDVKFQIAKWQRDERADEAAAESILAEAVDEHRAVPSLSMLVELLRAVPGKPLVEALLKLASVDEDALPHLDEAARVAVEVVADTSLARPILERTLDLAEERILEEPEEVTRETAAWCIYQLCQIAQEASDYGNAFALLTRGTTMKFQPELIRELQHRAAEVSAFHLGQPGQAIKLCSQVLAEEPNRTPTINLLAQLYESEGQLDALLELRQTELDLAPPLNRRLELRLELSRVFGSLGGNTKAQLKALRSNLDELPGHPQSIDALADILSPDERYEELYVVLCEQAALVADQGDGPAAARLFARGGLLAEETLDDVSRALSAYKHAVELDPDVKVLDALASIHASREQFADAVAWLRQRLSLTEQSQTTARRATLVRLGGALKSSGNDIEAISYLSAGLAEDPGAQEVRQLLASLREQREEWSEFAQLLSEGVEFADDPATQVSFLARAADVLWHELGDLHSAIPLLEQARHRQPDERQLRVALAEALRHAERFDEARDLLEGLLSEFGRRRTPERANVHFQLALISRAEHKLDDALTQLDEAAKIQRSEPLILKTLGDVAREKGELERAERAYRALLLLAGRNQQGGIGESAILFELYRIAAELHDPDRAKDLLDSAIEAADQNPDEALRLEDALREAKQWDLLLGALERRQARSQTSAEKREVLRARASVLVHLDRLSEALELRLQLVNGDPRDLELLDQTQALAEQCGNRERFIETLLQLANESADTDPSLSCELWLRVGGEAEAREDFPLAASLYERAQKTGKRPEQTFEALWRVHELTGDSYGLRVALEGLVGAPEDELVPETLTNALYQLAQLELCDREARSTGLERLEQALGREPDWFRAMSILEAALEVVPPDEPTLRMLETAARQLGDKHGLLRALVRITAQPTTTLQLLQEAVSLAEELQEKTQVLTLLRRTVEYARRTDTLSYVLWAVLRLAEHEQARERYEEAMALLTEAVAKVEESEQFELELRVADLAQRGLKDLQRAAEVYERLAEQEPSDARAWKPLLEVYRQSGQHARLEAILSRAEEHVVHAEERRSLQLERVRLLVDADRLEEAELSLKKALSEEPAHEEASELLIELLTSQGRAEEVRDLMHARLEAAIARADEAATVGYAMKLGHVCEKEDRAAAIAVYRTAHAAVRSNRDILSALLRLLPEDDVQERASLMESLLPAEDPEAAEALALQLAQLREVLEDEPGVERALELGFRTNPRSLPLRERLENWYVEREHFAPLAELLTLDGENREVLAQAIEQFQKAARIYDQQLGDAAMAADVLTKAQLRAPTDPSVLEPLSQHLLTAGLPERALSCINDGLAVEGLSGPERAVLLHLRAAVRARMDEHNLDAISEAIGDLDLARELGATATEEDLVALLERQRQLAESAGDPSTERAAVLRLSQLLPPLGQVERCIELIRKWVTVAPDDAEAVSIWGQLALKEQNWSSALQAYRHLFEVTEGARRLEAALRFAEACERAGSPMDARDVLESVNREMPGEESVRSRLRRMYEAAGAHKELAVLLLGEAENTSNKDARYHLLIDAGELLVITGQPSADAVNAFEQALKLKPRDHRAIVGLSRAFTISGEIEQACKILESAIKSHGKKRSPELSQLQHAMALIAQAAGDDEGRFAWLDAALQSDRKNGTVAAELAVFAMNRGEHDAAIKALQLVTLLKEECPMSRAEAYLRQGIIAQQRGDNKKAALLGKRALTADESYEPAQDFLQQLPA